MLKENDSLVQVKICGLTSMDDVHIIEKYGDDYAGMVLFIQKADAILTLLCRNTCYKIEKIGH